MADTSDARLYPQKEWYFDSTCLVIRVLRFLNFMEPDRTVVSVSKTYLWLSFLMLVICVFNGISDDKTMLALYNAIGGMILKMGSNTLKQWEAIDKRRNGK